MTEHRIPIGFRAVISVCHPFCSGGLSANVQPFKPRVMVLVESLSTATVLPTRTCKIAYWFALRRCLTSSPPANSSTPHLVSYRWQTLAKIPMVCPTPTTNEITHWWITFVRFSICMEWLPQISYYRLTSLLCSSSLPLLLAGSMDVT